MSRPQPDRAVIDAGPATPPRHGSRIWPIATALVLLLWGWELACQQVSAQATVAKPTEAATEAGVRDALQKYSAALESLNVDALKKVQPSIPVEKMAKAFKEMRELRVQIDTVRVLSVEGPTVRVSCRVTQTLTPRAGSRVTTAVTRVMRLRRESEGWLIDGFER